MCVVRWLGWENLFPHSWQQCGFSPVCVFSPMCAKYVFSPVCVCVQYGFTPSFSPVCVQYGFPPSFSPVRVQYGFSPVCVRMCLVRSLGWENLFPHSRQQYGFSPVCVRMCVIRLPAMENIFPHSWQKCPSTPWIFMCSVKYHFFVKRFLHGKQKNNFVSRAFLVCLIGDNFLTKHCPMVWQGLLSSELSRVVSDNGVAWG